LDDDDDDNDELMTVQMRFILNFFIDLIAVCLHRNVLFVRPISHNLC